MKTGTAHYLVTALPTLGEPGSQPPIALGAFREMAADQAWAREPVDAVLLLDDLMQRESFLAGESTEVAPTVLTPAQARNEEPLPELLRGADEAPESTATTLEADRLWSTYFRHVVDLSDRAHCPFLGEWARLEVGLRNALAMVRAERLGLAGDDFRVAPELESHDEHFDDLLSEWARAENPLDGYRLLIRARWEWTSVHERWYSFDADELAAYAVKLLLLHQAYRLSTFEEQASRRASGVTDQVEVETQ